MKVGPKWCVADTSYTLLVFLILILVLGFILVNSQLINQLIPVPELSSDLVNYSSKSANLTILYPKNLLASDTPQGNHGDKDTKMIITNYSSSPYIEVEIRNTPEGSLDEAVKWGEERANFQNNFTNIGVKSFNTSGYYGQAYIGTAREYFRSGGPFWNTRSYHCLDWYTFNSQKEYIFSFCVNRENWEKESVIFVQMIDSIQLKL